MNKRTIFENIYFHRKKIEHVNTLLLSSDKNSSELIQERESAERSILELETELENLEPIKPKSDQIKLDL